MSEAVRKWGPGSAPPVPSLLPVSEASRARRSMLTRTGLPRSAWGQRHDTVAGREWTRYLSDLTARLGIPRPVPRWSVEILRQAGRAHLLLLHVQALYDTELATTPPNRAEQRRLRSETRRALSSRSMLERLLAKIRDEQRAAARQAVPSVAALLDQVGRGR